MTPFARAGLVSVAVGTLALVFGSKRSPRRTPPSHPVPSSAPAGSTVPDVARAEVARWRDVDEASPEGDAMLREYWTATGQPYPGPDEAWSGAFVSWVVLHSNLPPNALARSGGHVYYARQAYKDRGRVGHYGAFRPDELVVEPGDLLVSRRPGGELTWDDIATEETAFKPAHGDVVVEAHGADLRVVGGNVDNRVTERSTSTSSSNLVAVLRYQPRPRAV